MMIDFALDAERKEGKSPRRGHLPGLPAALPADHDDDHGGAASAALPLALGTGIGLGAAPAARHRDRRRPDLQPDAHALHDAGRSTSPSTGWPGASGARRPSADSPRLAARGGRMNISRAVHPPAGRDHAADGRARAGRRDRLPLPAGVAAAAGRLPHDPGLGRSARRQPGDDGLVGGDAARAPVRPHRRRHRDDVDELARLDLRSCCSST